ncbi:nuclease-related domain-containing protein, partial [Vibrio parahaemolyticus]
MNIFEAFLNVLAQVWYLVPLLLIVSVFKSRWLKGVFGEFLVNRLLSKLPESDYTLIKDVTLPTSDGTTQVDHIVVSKYGIFVVETKNMKGWIFGSVRQKQWTQKIYRHSSKFQNPLHQNYKHIKALETLLGCSEEHLHSVIVFIGDSTFKTEMPPNVTYARGSIRYIQQFNDVVFSDNDYARLTESIN